MKCKHCMYLSRMGGAHYSAGVHAYCKLHKEIMVHGGECNDGKPSYARLKFLAECERSYFTEKHGSGKRRRKRQGC